MSWGTPDLLIMGMIALSILMGVARGFVKESISLVTWVAAIALSVLYSSDLAKHISFTKNALIQGLCSFLLIFVSVVFMGALVNYMAGGFIRKTPFSVPDRVLGSVFGFLRGVVLVSVLILLAGLTSFPSSPWWQESYMVSHFQGVAMWIRDRLPDENAKVFNFPGDPTYSQEKELDQA